MLKRSVSVRLNGFKKYDGNAEQICSQIVKDCWNGRYFQVSNGHYCEFYSRDFGICVDSLLKLGYKKEVRKTLEYALNIYSKHNGIYVAISPKGFPFNFPDVYSPDSVALFFRSLRVSSCNDLIKKYKDFLNNEVKRFYDAVLDKNTGLVKRKTHFSGMRDYFIRDSSCYDNIMVALLNDELKKIKILDNPLEDYDCKKIIKDNFWAGSYFLDDLSGSKHITGDANVFPFWTGVFNDGNMLKSTINKIRSSGLDSPFPIKYISGKSKENTIFIEFLVPDWEKNNVWPMMGPLFIQLVKSIDKEKAKEYIMSYTKIIEKYHNYLEIYTVDSKPYKSLFYCADESLLWAANYLTLITKTR